MFHLRPGGGGTVIVFSDLFILAHSKSSIFTD